MLGLQVIGTGQSVCSFDSTYTGDEPLILNGINPRRLLTVSGAGHLYESLDQGDTLISLGNLNSPVPAGAFNGWVYGGTSRYAECKFDLLCERQHTQDPHRAVPGC